MGLEQPKNSEIALNVTRTRITVLTFNLTVIALMLSIMSARGASTQHYVITHLTSHVALFVGFCLTILGILWLLYSQNCDSLGMSRPWPFTLGSMTMYLALSQTVTAFMHEYLIGIKLAVEAPLHSEGQALVRLDALGDTALLVLFIMGGGIWILATYIAPFFAVLKSPIPKGHRWLFASYYFALQVPVYWVYARAWHLVYVPSDQPINMLKLFALQFVQPLLWLS